MIDYNKDNAWKFYDPMNPPKSNLTPYQRENHRKMVEDMTGKQISSGRCIILSDCHGSPHLITNVLKHSNYNINEDRLVFAGDLLDIGTDPQTCLKILRENKAELLWGNHDAAIVLRKFISPQDPYSWELYEKLRTHQDEFKNAAIHDNILITHAGLSSAYFLDEYNVELIAATLNETSLKDLWSNDNILWYRPDDIKPHPGIIQVVGHTPPIWFRPRLNFYTVDPFTKVGFDRNRYRYAVIQNGFVEIFDSNIK